MRSSLALFACLGLGAAALFVPRDARACGGCFAPPTENTVVTDHRMVLSISTKETTLYDQIRYAGAPSSFAWVLPIRGLAKVGISTDLMFQSLDQSTQTEVIPPPENCPSGPSCYVSQPHCDDGAQDAGAARSSSDASAGSPQNKGDVDIVKEETVGPYETVQLKATDPNALTQWLSDHGYALPADVAPLVKSYVDDGFGFLALKLVPGAGTQSMKPVRVTTQGANPSLPLRMVAAGSGATVGVTLWVVGEGRWEPQSFPSYAVHSSDLVWTWATRSSNLGAFRTQKQTELGAAAWEIEASIDLPESTVESSLSFYANASMPPTVRLDDGGFGPYRVYTPITLDDGGVVDNQAVLLQEDMDALFQDKAVARVTRMRSDLPRASLATDLALQAAVDQSELPLYRQITREADEPQCAVYQGCTPTGAAPRSVARDKALTSCGGKGDGNTFCVTQEQVAAANPPRTCSGNGSSLGGGPLGCSVLAGSSASGVPLAALAMLGLSALARRRANRRR